MDRHLHIITPGVPFLGKADVFSSLIYKVKALKEAGIKVHLHCFDNENVEMNSAEIYCHEVHYYERKKLLGKSELFLPYTLASRSNINLIDRLNLDGHPILFEGLQCVYPLLREGILKKRKTLVRIHRLESKYFLDLARIRHWGMKKAAFFIESVLFRKIESKIAGLSAISVSSEKLLKHFKKTDPKKSISYFPEFTGVPGSYFQEGNGGFCLYHGDLSKRENEYAAKWLLEHVFNKIEIPFVIAGYGPSKSLEHAAHLRMHTCLVSNPGEKEILDLIKKAQICLIPSFIASDNKSPILKSLALGKHVLTNAKGIPDADMMTVCEVARTPNEFIRAIQRLFNEPFEKETFEKREAYLNRIYRDSQSAQEVVRLLY